MNAEELIDTLERWAQPLPECATKNSQYMAGIDDARKFVLQIIHSYKLFKDINKK